MTEYFNKDAAEGDYTGTNWGFHTAIFFYDAHLHKQLQAFVLVFGVFWVAALLLEPNG